jgi:hypothetical protein
VCGNEPVPWLDRHRERRRKFVAQLDIDQQDRNAMRRPNAPPLAVIWLTTPAITTNLATAESQ